MKIDTLKIKICLLAFLLLAAVEAPTQQKLSKDALVQKANALVEARRAREALALIGEHPEYADETEILYLQSIAYVDLRDFENADRAFQKQFDLFSKNGDESRAAAGKILADAAPTRENKSLAALMYGTALVSYATADLANSLRAAAFEKAGVPAARREPKNLGGFDEFRKNYEETALKAGELAFASGQLKDALENFSRAIELNEQNAAAFAARAKVYRRLKRVRLAVADEARAKRLAAAR